MPTVKVPFSLNIGAHPFRIQWHYTDDLRDEALNGRINHRSQVIEVNNTRPPSQQLEAFFHEVLHGVNAIYTNSDVTEHTIDHLAQGLTQVLVCMGVELDWSNFQTKEGQDAS